MVKRLFRKVLCFCIVFGMALISISGSASSSSDIQDGKYETAIEVITALGIMSKSDNGAFDPGGPVTKAELAAMAVKAADLDTARDNGTTSIFKDVDPVSDAGKYISLAAKIGLVSGDNKGMFHPDENVTYQQSLKILVNLIGFGVVAESRGGYPAGYISVAAEKQITSGIKENMDGYVTRGAMAQMLYNTMNVPIMQRNWGSDSLQLQPERKDDTLFNRMLGTKERYGQITGNHSTHLTNNQRMGEDEVEITVDNLNTPIIYKAGDTNAASLLGYKVEFYAKYDKSKDTTTLLCVLPQKSKCNSLTIDADKVSKFEGNEVQYIDENDRVSKIQTAKLSPGAAYIYNGVYAADLTSAQLLPSSGNIRLLDNNSDGMYDVVFITSYMNVVVSSALLDNGVKKIYFKPGSYPIGGVEFDPNDSDLSYSFYYNGKLLSKDEIIKTDIKEWMVFSIAQSKTPEVMEIRISDGAVSGKVEEIENLDDAHNSKNIVIAGKAYKTAPEFNDVLTLGENYSFVLSFNNEIVSKGSDNDSGKKYAYLMDLGKGAGAFDNKPEFKLLLSTGEQTVLKGADKICFNNSTVDSITLVSILPINQVITYEQDKDGNINRLNTASQLFADRSNPNYAKKYDEDNFSLDVRDTLYFKTSSPPTMGNDANGIEVKLSPKTIIFDVSDPDPDEWGVGDYNFFLNDQQYSVDVYDNDRFKCPAVVVNKGAIDPDVENNVSWTANSLLIEKIVQSVNSLGETSYKVYGIENNARVEKIVKNADVCDEYGKNKIVTLSPGSVVQCKYDHKGQIKQIRLLHEGNDLSMEERTWSGSENLVNLYTCYAVCEDKSSNILTMTMDNGNSSKAYSTGLAKYYVFDTVAKKARLGSVEDIKPRSAFGNDASRLFIRVSKNDTQEVIIYTN